MDRRHVQIMHWCYICGDFEDIYAGNIVRHIWKAHNTSAKTRPANVNRPKNSEFAYVSKSVKKYRGEIHYACVSCWFHCPKSTPEFLREHVRNEHHPFERVVNEGKTLKREEKNEEYEDQWWEVGEEEEEEGQEQNRSVIRNGREGTVATEQAIRNSGGTKQPQRQSTVIEHISSMGEKRPGESREKRILKRKLLALGTAQSEFNEALMNFIDAM